MNEDQGPDVQRPIPRPQRRYNWLSFFRPTVEPASLMSICFFTINSTVTQTFFTYLFCLQSFENSSQFSNDAKLDEICENQIFINQSYKTDPFKLSAKTSEWMFYTGLVMYVPGFFTANMLGALCDNYSPKLAVIIPIVGNVIGMGVCNLVVYFADRRYENN